ncbi:MAG: hypothetical protein ACLT5P_02865 [Flavonifractor plautii]
MSDTELQFRTSTFGGFQKQDVLNYIETSNQEHREKLEAVRRELAETEAAKAAQAEEIAAAQAQTEAKEKELQALRGELAAAHKEAEERKLEISLLEEELEKAKQRLGDTEARLKESEEKLAKAGPAAAAYEKVKDRTAGIELEAHCRAQAVQAEAEERIRKTRAGGAVAEPGTGELTACALIWTGGFRACGELDQVRNAEQIPGAGPPG